MVIWPSTIPVSSWPFVDHGGRSTAATHHFVLNLPNCCKNIALNCTGQLLELLLNELLRFIDIVESHFLLLIFLIYVLFGGKLIFELLIQLDYQLITGLETKQFIKFPNCLLVVLVFRAILTKSIGVDF